MSYRTVAFFAAMVLSASAASAQVAPSLLIQPWPEQPTLAQTYDHLFLISEGHTQGDDGDVSTFVWDSYGRVKFDRQDTDPGAVVGYRFFTMAVDADRRDIDGAYNDLAVAGAFQVGTFDEWELGLIGGVGSANDNHWDEGDANYGLGTVNLSRSLGEHEQLHIGLNYDGNRLLWPDAPLPYISYVNTTRDNLVYVIGVPVSSITWRPIEALTLSANYQLPYNITGRVSYALTPKLSLFTEYDRSFNAFHEHDATREHQRLFYRLSTWNTGVTCENKWLGEVSLGVGYAFDQEFSRGWDLQDTTGVASPSDEVLFFLKVRGMF
jgi:hypothetical protein